MERFQSEIEIGASSSACYQQWRRFDEFPQFMKNVEQVSPVSDKRWHWVVNGPLGQSVEWDADIDGNETNRLISWHSVPGSKVQVQGAVLFDEIATDKTRVTCTIQYEPPASVLGEVVAHLFSNPQTMVAEDLANFKHLMEQTNIPADKASVGQVAQASALAAQPLINDEDDYESVYALDLLELEDELPATGSITELDPEDRSEIQHLRDEEEPYLATGGALYSEDLIDMRADAVGGLEEGDVFTESMDIDEEDLERYTEGLDEEIDIGMGPRESIQDYQNRQSETPINPNRS